VRVSSGREERGWIDDTKFVCVYNWPSFWYNGSVRDVSDDAMVYGFWIDRS
jgi:hypothetical protein